MNSMRFKQVFSQEAALKAKELRWFKAARAVCSIFPSEEPEQPQPPAPDIRFANLDLGIEITEYLGKQKGGSARRKHESQRDEVLREAQQLFETTGNGRLFVSIFWTPERDVTAETRDILVKGIVTVVNHLVADGRETWQPNWTIDRDQLLGQYIGDIWIYRPSVGPSNWTSVEGGAVGGDVERVQNTIGGKESRVAKYRSICGKVWLLIVAETRISSYFSPDEDFDGAIFRTDFDRVFILDVFRNRLRELRLQRL